MTSGSLTLTQTIFDMSKWRQLTLQEKTAGISDVTFQTAEQSLILNTATAYFNVLKAIDKLSYTQAQKDAVYRTLDQTTQRFNVGLVAITDVQNARSNYDTVLAAEVSARNDLDNALETLRQVTGAFYPELASLNTDRFSTQRPEAVNNLLKEAEARNLSLLSARLSQIRRASKSAQPKPVICRRLTSARQPASAIPNTTAPKPEARMLHATAIPMRAKIRSASASTCRCTAAVRPIPR